MKVNPKSKIMRHDSITPHSASVDPRAFVNALLTELSAYRNHFLPPCFSLCTFATKIKEGIIKTGKITATSKL